MAATSLSQAAIEVITLIAKEGPKGRKQVFEVLGTEGTAELAALAHAGLLSVSEDEMPPRFSLTQAGAGVIKVIQQVSEVMGGADAVTYHHGEEDVSEQFRTMRVEQPEDVLDREQQQRMFMRSGQVSSFDPLVAIFYTLLRDGTLPPDKLDRVLSRLESDAGSQRMFVNGWIAKYANDAVDRLFVLAEMGQVAHYMHDHGVSEEEARADLGYQSPLVTNAPAKDVPEENLN